MPNALWLAGVARNLNRIPHLETTKSEFQFPSGGKPSLRGKTDDSNCRATLSELGNAA